MTKAPSFWNLKKANWIAVALLPLSLIYCLITKLRLLISSQYKSKIPVVCVGNFTMGGAGKTPVTLSLYAYLKELGLNPCILTRGYGGKISGPQIITTNTDSPAMVGDEPFMMAQYANVVVSKDRQTGAQFIERFGYNCILMDDGFQNPSLVKDQSFVVVDAGAMLGNQCVFPAGPLREPLSRALKRADNIILLGETTPENDLPNFAETPILRANLVKNSKTSLPIHVVAFAGIGRPQKFYNSLKNEGVSLLDTIDFPDHHYYIESELQVLFDLANTHKAGLITTEKDWVKLPKSWQDKIQYLPISIQWDRPEEIKKILQSITGLSH